MWGLLGGCVNALFLVLLLCPSISLPRIGRCRDGCQMQIFSFRLSFYICWASVARNAFCSPHSSFIPSFTAARGRQCFLHSESAVCGFVPAALVAPAPAVGGPLRLPCGPHALPCCLARQDVAGLCRASLGSPARGGVWEPVPGLSWAQGPQPHDPSAEEAASASLPQSREEQALRPAWGSMCTCCRLSLRACPRSSVSRMLWAGSFCPGGAFDGLWQDTELICGSSYSLLGSLILILFYF